MPDTMIERVARAIDAAGQKDTLETYGIKNAAMCFDEAGSEENRKLMFVLAKAAIEAMREPTNDMANEYFKLRKEVGDIDATACFNVSVWETSIDAALKDISCKK